jgi:hypothetical protein
VGNKKYPWYFRLILALLLLGFVEGFSWLTIGLLRAGAGRDIRRVAAIYEDQSARIRRFLDPGAVQLEQFDPGLGWRYTPGFRGDRHRINHQGLRGDREYATAPPPGVDRLAAFGDSFVYGNEVDTPDSWPARLETELGGAEVLNFGVGGYGTDQAWLRYRREGRRFGPRIVLIGFVPDDIRRNVNVYRRFLSDHELPLFKPRFRMSDDGVLRLLPCPLAEALRARRIRCLDAAAAFPAGPGAVPADWFAAGGHYSPEGNGLVAVWLAGELRKWMPATGPPGQ